MLSPSQGLVCRGSGHHKNHHQGGDDSGRHDQHSVYVTANLKLVPAGLFTGQVALVVLTKGERACSSDVIMQQCNRINIVRAMNMVLQLHVCHVCCRHIYYIHDVFYGASLDIEYPLLPCGKSLDLAVPDKSFQ